MTTLGSITLQSVWSMPWIMFVFQVKWAQMISWVKHLTQKSRNRETRNANYKFTEEKLEVTGDCGLPKVLQSLGLFRELLILALTPGPQAWCLLSASPLQFRLVDVGDKMRGHHLLVTPPLFQALIILLLLPRLILAPPKSCECLQFLWCLHF